MITNKKNGKMWGEKPYRSLDYTLKKQFGEKVYKLSLNGGMTCPNRDGKVGVGGCIFCSAGGSGDFAADRTLSITQQIQAQKEALRDKKPARKYIAYFQAYTNTYAPVDYLERIYREALADDEVVALSIGTRPDCLPDEVLDLLGELNQIKPVWIELGLQTMHEQTAQFIRRGYELPCFERAVSELRKRDITVIVHTIVGLPREGREEILQTIEYLNHQDIQGIKLQLLHVLRGTDLGILYETQTECAAQRGSAESCEADKCELQEHDAQECGALEHDAQECGALEHDAQECGALEHDAQECGAREHDAWKRSVWEHGVQECGALEHGAQECGVQEHGVRECDTREYQRIDVMTMEEYIDTVLECLAHLRSDITVHRLTGDGPKDLLLAPLWSSRKRTVLNTIHSEMKQRNIWQGKLLQEGE